MLRRNIRAFNLLANYAKWMITPTTFRTLFTAPLCVLCLLFTNKVDGRKLRLKELSDEFSELVIQMVKQLLRKNNQRRDGQMKSIMDRVNFMLLSALHHGLWRPNAREYRRKITRKWMPRPFDCNDYSDYAMKTMNSLRGMVEGNDDGFWRREWQAIYSTKRIKTLIEMIKKYEDIGEFEEDEIVEQILNGRKGDTADQDIEMIDASEAQKKAEKKKQEQKKKAEKKKKEQKKKAEKNKKEQRKKDKENKSKKLPRQSIRRS
eukprot:909073_1